jgi:hypothetical protein
MALKIPSFASFLRNMAQSALLIWSMMGQLKKHIGLRRSLGSKRRKL